MNQVLFLTAPGSLTNGVIMGMEMRCAVRHGIRRGNVPFQTLLQIAGLSDVDRHPTSILGLPGINEIARRRPQSRVYGIDRVRISLPRLAGPVSHIRSRTLPFPVTTEQLFEQVHRAQVTPLDERSVKP